VATPERIPIGSWKGVFARWKACTVVGWLFAIYDRLLISRVGRFLPFGGNLVAISLRGNSAPFFLRLGNSDWMSLDEIFIRRAYSAVRNLHLGSEPNILDLGANVGFSARFWRSEFPNACIIAVEPDEGNLAMCRHNMKGHEFRFILIGACAGGQRRFANLDTSDGGWGIKMKANEGTGNGSVEVLTIPDILERAGHQGAIHLLKCDIEGAEREVFKCCATWIHRVRNIVIELHGDYSTAFFLRDLKANGACFDSQELDSGESYRTLLLRNRVVRE
jgi:FkbM family methyltransferase